MMVFSTSVTSSPNGSFEAAAGGVAEGGACADAGDRIAKLTAAAATTDNHQVREGIIGFSPASLLGETSNRQAGCNLDNTRCSDPLAIYSLHPYKQGQSARSRHERARQPLLYQNERSRQRDRGGGHARRAAGDHRRRCPGRCRGGAL